MATKSKEYQEYMRQKREYPSDGRTSDWMPSAILLLAICITIFICISWLLPRKTGISSMWAILIAGLLSAFFCAGLMLAVIPTTIKKKKMQRCTVQVVAEICNMFAHEASGDMYSSQINTPLYRYQYAGKVWYYMPAASTTGRPGRVGDKFVGFCNPENPAEFVLKNTPIGLQVFTGLFAGICLLVSGGMLLGVIIACLT